MNIRIEETLRCKLFEGIASKVWNDINHHHKVKIDMPEIGITSHIIADILTYRINFEKNLDVYTNKAYDENTYGGDIDVFVETDPNRYRWFALQAKALKHNKKYDTIRYNGKSRQQWESLRILENMTGCKAYYLLYNGMYTKHSLKLNTDSCYRMFADEQFGCSLVKLNKVEEVANKKNPNGNYKTPSYDDFHPYNAQPWRTLVCCYLDKGEERQTLYALEDIEEDCKNYYPAQEDFNLEKEKASKEDINSESYNLQNEISVARREAKWNPDYRVIIKRTDNNENDKF